MAPMTRCRSIGNIPGDLVAMYYGQRAGAGLIVTEGASPSPNGLGYARIPGLFNPEQQAGWKLVADAVHKAGSKIFVQLMHSGRVGHPLNLPEGASLLGPSAVAAPGKMWTDSGGMKEHPAPQAMTEEQILATIQEYAHSAELAVAAGLDGVELHGANGYLIDQFLNTQSNQRTDQWGGSIENRMRFAMEVAKAVSARIGADRTGIRLSPYGAFNGMGPDPDHDALYLNLSKALGTLGLVYVHLVDHSSMGAPMVNEELKRGIQAEFGGTLIRSGGYDANRAQADLEEGLAHLVAFGRPFISNPNLVDKLKSGEELAPADSATFYTADSKGYTDYPA